MPRRVPLSSVELFFGFRVSEFSLELGFANPRAFSSRANRAHAIILLFASDAPGRRVVELHT